MGADTSSPPPGTPPASQPKGTKRQADANPDPLVGRVVAGRYRVDARLASGGMGVVYRAEQQPLGRPVALKVLKTPGDGQLLSQFTERFLLEAASMARLQHPNTVVIHDYGQDGGVLYFTMEFLDGETLTQRVRRRGPMEPEDAIHVATQIASSLGDAHATGLVHRDLKPGNVMLIERGGDRLFVKVLDFGLVKLVHGDAKQQLTQSGIILGSPRYMAPEQVRGMPLDSRADIYAFGCLLCFLLTARPPFPAGGPFEAMRAHVYEDPPSLRDLDPHCIAGERLEAVIQRCLRKSPDERFATMSQVADALRHAALAPRLSNEGAFDLQVTSVRPESAAKKPAASAPQSTTPLGQVPVPAKVPNPEGQPFGPSKAPFGPPTLPLGGLDGPSQGPPMEMPSAVSESRSELSAAFGEATAAWQRFRVRILLAAAAMITLLGVVSLALFLPGQPLGMKVPARRAPTVPVAPPVVEATPPAPAPVPTAAPAPATREVRLASDPEGAEVLRDGVVLGDTPLVLEMPEDARWTLELTAAGHETRTVTLSGSAREVTVTLPWAGTGARPRRRAEPAPPVETAPETPRGPRTTPPPGRVIVDPWNP
ncbi:MAG: serine/threonine-protein kinase [Myxococcota bacterium]